MVVDSCGDPLDSDEPLVSAVSPLEPSLAEICGPALSLPSVIGSIPVLEDVDMDTGPLSSVPVIGCTSTQSPASSPESPP